MLTCYDCAGWVGFGVWNEPGEDALFADVKENGITALKLTGERRITLFM